MSSLISIRWLVGCASAVLGGVVLPGGGLVVRAAEIDFNRDVRPILSDRCFLCHGPDPANRQADLRLDDRSSAVASGTIVPGDSAASELFARISQSDPALLMPPPDSGKALTAEQIEVLRRWIDAGAPFAEHWAFLPPERPPSQQ